MRLLYHVFFVCFSHHRNEEYQKKLTEIKQYIDWFITVHLLCGLSHSSYKTSLVTLLSYWDCIVGAVTSHILPLENSTVCPYFCKGMLDGKVHCTLFNDKIRGRLTWQYFLGCPAESDWCSLGPPEETELRGHPPSHRTSIRHL